MNINEYHTLKKGDIVQWIDKAVTSHSGSKCVVLHFDTSDYPPKPPCRQKPNNDQNLCVIFIEDNLRLIGHCREFENITRKKSE